MARIDAKELVGKEGVDPHVSTERPAIYMAGPTADEEAELGWGMQEIIERFMNVTDFIDPTSLHDVGEGGGKLETDVGEFKFSGDFWREDGTFDKEKYRNIGTDSILDLDRDKLDETDVMQQLMDVVEDQITDIVDIDLFPPGIDIDIPGPLDLIEGLFSFIWELIKDAILASDGVFVARKRGQNMAGAAMEMKFAHDNGIPVSIYNHNPEGGDNIGMMMDIHADYVTSNPNWAVSYLVDEAEKHRQAKDSDDEPQDSEENEVPAA